MASQDRHRRRNPALNTSLTAPTECSFRHPQLDAPNRGYQGGHPVELIVVVPPTQGPAGPGWPVRCSEGGQNGLDQVGRLVGNIVGMAYVVARPKGRFEIRESVHTPKGPRARSLANFSELTDDVLARARQRARRPFDADAVRAAAARAAAPHHQRPETRQFVEASRRMARSLERVPPPTARRDPGDVLIGLLGFVARVKQFGPARAPEPLGFPPLARLRAERIARASHR